MSRQMHREFMTRFYLILDRAPKAAIRANRSISRIGLEADIPTNASRESRSFVALLNRVNYVKGMLSREAARL